MKKQIANMMVITFLLAGLAGCGSKEPPLTPSPASTASSGTMVGSQPEESESKPAAPAGGDLTQESILEYPETDPSLFGYSEFEDGLLIDGCKSEDEVIVVPKEFNGQKIVGVDIRGMGGLDVRAVVLPDTVTILREGAFSNCEKLEYIHLGSGLKTVGKLVFNFCKSLKQVTFPEGTEEFTSYPFYGCVELEKIVVPASVTSMPEGMGGPEDCPKAVVVTPEGSLAEEKALEFGFPVEHP